MMHKEDFTSFVDSAGGIIVNTTTGHIAMVQNETSKWGFPKGTVEKDEALLDAAKREILEETGLTQLEYIKEFSSYTRPNSVRPHEQKTIHMFLFNTNQDKLAPIVDDILSAQWIEKKMVLQTLSTGGDKEFFRSIMNHI